MQYLGRCPCAIPELWAAQEAFRTRVCQTHRPWMLLGPSCSKHAVNCPASTSASVIPQELRCLKPAATDAEKNDTCTWGRFVALGCSCSRGYGHRTRVWTSAHQHPSERDLKWPRSQGIREISITPVPPTLWERTIIFTVVLPGRYYVTTRSTS